MDQKKADTLIVKLFEQGLSRSEAVQLEKWLKQGKNLDYFNEFVELKQLIQEKEPFDYEQSLAVVKKRINSDLRKKRRARLYRYAAVFVMIIGLGYYFYSVSGGKIPSNTSTIVKKEEPRIINNEIIGGEGKAILTLGDSTKIALGEDTAFEKENVKSDGSALEYNVANAENKSVEYNVLTIPRGGQFSIRLADGTKVWLNSETKLKYPTAFLAGQPRQVELLYGEAYFDVSPSTDHHGDRFIVVNSDLEAEVYGTEFNIKSYRDEANTYTTLAEGKVEVRKGGEKVILEPYQQAITTGVDENIAVESLTSLRELAWRKGVFSFKNKPLDEIMTVLSRWYDMQVVFKSSTVQNIEFTGVLGKKQSIEEIMTTIRQTNDINYEIKNKTLTIE